MLHLTILERSRSRKRIDQQELHSCCYILLLHMFLPGLSSALLPASSGSLAVAGVNNIPGIEEAPLSSPGNGRTSEVFN